MSLSWRDRVRVLLAPGRVTLARVSFPHRIHDAAMRPCGEAREAVLATLGAALDEKAFAAAPVEVALSGAYVRYALTDPVRVFLDTAGREALGRHVLGAIHGAAVEDWEVRAAALGFGAPFIAAGIERPLLQGLVNAIVSSGREIRSVQPALVAVLNRLRPRLRRFTGALAVAEPGRIGLLLFKGGRVRGLAHRLSGDPRATVWELIEHQTLRAGIELGSGELWMPGFDAGFAPPPKFAGWKVRAAVAVPPHPALADLPLVFA